ncbi:MAG: sigma-70 family RNA polymerase sigma factor [Oscillospiraceae bacterium]|nr:sigma-70 family RNA polymerase sigma factor [Oscillospiraceae bacterium]MBR2502765.1 sigma-70 family RNA polymerase sigma factor [Oscillospiraceae bacterium]
MQKEIEQYVALAKQGSHKDMEYVFREFRASIESCAYKLRTPYFDFEDAVQEGNIGLFRAVLSYSPDKGASFSTYAKKCILNSIITAYNSSQSHKHQILSDAKELKEDDSFSDFEDDFLIKEQNKEFIKTAKQKLSKFEFLVFSLYTMQYSYKEIAETTGKDEKSVNNAIQRIHKKLRK